MDQKKTEHKRISLADAKCHGLTMEAPVTLAASGNDKGADFQVAAYTGEVVDRWWGKLAIDISGIRAKKKMPILRDHDRGKIVGYSLDSWADGSFNVSGQFSKITDEAKEVRGLAEEGFPWQASIGVKPLTVLEIKSGTSTVVNGKIVAGPAEIWVESEVYETSFVPLGADGNTSVAMLSKINEVAQGANSETTTEKENSMDKLTLELLSKEAPELLGQIRESAKKEGLEAGKVEGATAERERIKSVQDQTMPGHESLVATLMFDGKTTGPEAAVAVLNAEKKARADVFSQHKNDAPPALQQPSTDGESLSKKTGTVEELAKADWDKDEKLRAEFYGNFGTYLAYAKSGRGQNNK